MKELTTLELILTAVAVEISKEDPTAERMKVVHNAIVQKLENEIKTRGIDEYLKACNEMTNIDADFKPIADGMKKIFDAAREMKEALNKM